MWTPFHCFSATFHRRFKTLILLSAIGSFYTSYLEVRFPNRYQRSGLWLFAMISYISMLVNVLLNVIHILFFEMAVSEFFYDLMVLCAGFQGIIRLSYFKMYRPKIENVCNTWDEEFGDDELSFKREVRDFSIRGTFTLVWVIIGIRLSIKNRTGEWKPFLCAGLRFAVNCIHSCQNFTFTGDVTRPVSCFCSVFWNFFYNLFIYFHYFNNRT